MELKCSACSKDTKILETSEIVEYLKQVPEWALSEDGKRIKRQWRVKNFQEGMNFINLIAKIAEEEKHHPDLHLERYQFVTIELWTHSIGGLSENDFILATKIDKLPVVLSKYHRST